MDESPGRFPPPPEDEPPRAGQPPQYPPPPGQPPYGPQPPYQPPPYGQPPYQPPPYGQPPYQPPPYQPAPQFGFPPEPRSFYPLDLNRIIELTISLFRFRWRTFVGIALIVMTPALLVLTVGSTVLYDPTLYGELTGFAMRQEIDLFFQRFWQAFLTNIVIGLVIGAVVGITGLIATGAMADAAAVTFAGGSTKATASVRRSLSRVGTFAGIYLLTLALEIVVIFFGVLVGGALFLSSATEGRVAPGPLVFVGLIVFVATIVLLAFLLIRLALSVQVAMLEGTGALESLRRSWRLVSGSTLRVFGYMLLFGLVVAIIAGLLSAVASIALNPVRVQSLTTFEIDPVRYALTTFLSGVIAAALAPVVAISMTLLYFDLRSRRGEQVPQPGGAPSAQAPIPPPPT